MRSPAEHKTPPGERLQKLEGLEELQISQLQFNVGRGPRLYGCTDSRIFQSTVAV
jgi:hypothetical protein